MTFDTFIFYLEVLTYQDSFYIFIKFLEVLEFSKVFNIDRDVKYSRHG